MFDIIYICFQQYVAKKNTIYTFTIMQEVNTQDKKTCLKYNVCNVPTSDIYDIKL